MKQSDKCQFLDSHKFSSADGTELAAVPVATVSSSSLDISPGRESRTAPPLVPTRTRSKRPESSQPFIINPKPNLEKPRSATPINQAAKCWKEELERILK
jgi:hypothetical protein